MKLSKKLKRASIITAILIYGICIASAATINSGMISAQVAICDILFNVRQLLFYIASGVAVVTIMLQGVKWIGSAEDAGARKQAKTGIVHAVVGLIIVMIAVWVVLMVMPGAQCAV